MRTTKETLTVDEIKAATAALEAHRQTMEFLLPLTSAERLQKKRLGTKAIRTAEKRLLAAQQHREALPASFDLKRFERDVAVMLALEGCLEVVARIHAELQDTLLVLGGRGVRTANEAYAHIKAASSAAPDLKRTVSQLIARRSKLDAKPSGTEAVAAAPAQGTPPARNPAAAAAPAPSAPASPEQPPAPETKAA